MRQFDELKTHEARRKAVLVDQIGRCNRCGINEWLGQPLALELEHKDGDRHNNSRDNLECLCPNCHSLTPTWRGRNKGVKVTDDLLVRAMKEHGTIYAALSALKMAPKGNNYARAKRLFEEHNLVRRRTMSWKVLEDETVDKALALRQVEGLSYRKLAERLGVNRGTLMGRMKTRTLRDSNPGP